MIEKTDYDPSMGFMNRFTSKMLLMKDEVLSGVIKQCLGRDWFLDSEVSARFEFIKYENKGEREFIAFDGVEIGEIKMEWRNEGNGVVAGWKFVPHSMV
jgi:hypothetical protein